MQNNVLILDFGSQYTQLIARRVRELNIYCEIQPYNKAVNFDENIKKQEEYQKVSKEIAEKQEMLQKLFDEVMNDEMKELYEEIQKLLEELDKK